jgi:hypothetical protein
MLCLRDRDFRCGRNKEQDDMDLQVHNLNSLFAQLGEPNDEASIARFIDTHGPLPDAQRFHEAPFWTPSQASFLCESLLNDADWADAADELNMRLHQPH